MKSLKILFCIITLLAGQTLATNEEKVVVLTDSTLHDFVTKNPHVLVKFYADWCMHCKSLAPEYEKAAELLKAEGSSIVLAKVNNEDGKELLNEFMVEGFPTLKFFKNGYAIDYTGNRQADGIVEWCKEIVLPSVKPTTDLKAELEANPTSIVFVAAGTDPESKLHKRFESEADKFRTQAKFFHVAEGDGTVSVYHPGQEAFKFVGNEDDDLSNFFKVESLPLFSEIDQNNYMSFILSGKNLSWFCGSEDDYKTYKDAFTKAARTLRDTTVFVWVDSVKFESIKDVFVIKTVPAVAHQTQEGRYIMENNHYSFNSPDSIVSFYKDVDAGLIKKTIRSEEAPETQEGKVTTLVGTTLATVVGGPKNVLLLIHAPHCEHCKTFLPTFEEFADFAPSLHVCKFNGDANESPLDSVKWDSFPTVLFFKAKSVEPVVFSGERTFDGLKEFVTQQGVEVADVHTEL